ncbi:unnamed protein product [Pleuronectes platessa]|uniref:Uncharacterized protein n=1 Tax=Pleuronectes platessa TaxID=8262 RepID=A0A9N7YB20_PLEPL|nr:unnamed protein product [Pleuronectes platessa]
MITVQGSLLMKQGQLRNNPLSSCAIPETSASSGLNCRCSADHHKKDTCATINKSTTQSSLPQIQANQIKRDRRFKGVFLD